MKVMLSGCGGFVGAHVLRHILMTTDWQVIAPVSFKHKGMPERIESSICGDPEWAKRVEIIHWDMVAPAPMSLHAALGGDTDVFMNVASESHVDRSISEPVDFVLNNVALMLNVLELARKHEPKLLLQMSTDEVYGPAYGDHRHSEWETIAPSNPYSGSKAAQEAIAFSYWRTYSVPVVITNTMNIIGEMMDTEKFFPMIIRSLANDMPITVHTAPDGTPGSRFYLHARNLADAWVWLTRMYSCDLPDGSSEVSLRGPSMYGADGVHLPDRYHIVGEQEIDNLSFVHMIADIMGKEPRIVLQSFHESRPGHDLRYALDGSKLDALGWKPPVPLRESLEKAVRWTLDRPEWLEL